MTQSKDQCLVGQILHTIAKICFQTRFLLSQNLVSIIGANLNSLTTKWMSQYIPTFLSVNAVRSTLTVFLTFVCGQTTLGAPPDPTALAARIDKRLSARWEAEKVKPAPQTDDTAFVRRVYLDLAGRIPTTAEVRDFVEAAAPNKRTVLIASLVDSSAHARHMAIFWRREWVPQTDTPRFATLADQLDIWLANRLRDGVGYDVLVRDLLTASRIQRQVGETKPTTFLAANEFKPENLAAGASRAFLGVNLDCAQCHNHPFSRWTRDQFWETAAFFASPANGAVPVIAIPGTEKQASPKALTGDNPKWPKTLTGGTGAALFAEWATSRDNPFFARNAVNRLWANLFGSGLVEPLDDLSDQNPSDHPELLDELAKAFADSGFDLKFLAQALTLTKAYQLSASSQPVPPKLFARAAVRGLTGEQLYDSLRVAAGLPVERDDLDPTNAHRERKRFAEKFRVERTGTAQRSILQSLALMNGAITTELTNTDKTPMLRSIADAPFLDTKGRVEAMFLASLGRRPTTTEAEPLERYLDKGGANGIQKRALADIFWAILNSSEFNTNH